MYNIFLVPSFLSSLHITPYHNVQLYSFYIRLVTKHHYHHGHHHCQCLLFSYHPISHIILISILLYIFFLFHFHPRRVYHTDGFSQNIEICTTWVSSLGFAIQFNSFVYCLSLLLLLLRVCSCIKYTSKSLVERAPFAACSSNVYRGTPHKCLRVLKNLILIYGILRITKRFPLEFYYLIWMSASESLYNTHWLFLFSSWGFIHNEWHRNSHFIKKISCINDFLFWFTSTLTSRVQLKCKNKKMERCTRSQIRQCFDLCEIFENSTGLENRCHPLNIDSHPNKWFSITQEQSEVVSKMNVFSKLVWSLSSFFTDSSNLQYSFRVDWKIPFW